MQDNDRVYIAKFTKIQLEERGVQTIKHPPYLLDLNSIKHMWWALKKKLHELHPEFNQLGESAEEWSRFCEALKEAWLAIPDTLIRKLIYSMPRRLEAVKEAKGYQTKY